MLLLPPAEPQWTLHTPEWREAVQRLRGGRAVNPLYTLLLTPLVDQFEAAWGQLRQLAVVAESFAPPPGQPVVPIQRLAEFILDDVIDVFRGAASELVLLIPSEDRWCKEPSPNDVLEEASRFQRLLVVAAMAAGACSGDALSATTIRVAGKLDGWSDAIAPLVEAVASVLDAVQYGKGEAFGAEPGRSEQN